MMDTVRPCLSPRPVCDCCKLVLLSIINSKGLKITAQCSKIVFVNLSKLETLQNMFSYPYGELNITKSQTGDQQSIFDPIFIPRSLFQFVPVRALPYAFLCINH